MSTMIEIDLKVSNSRPQPYVHLNIPNLTQFADALWLAMASTCRAAAKMYTAKVKNLNINIP